MNLYKQLSSLILLISMLFANSVLASEPVKSGAITIDETQVSLILGGNMGGGVVVMGNETRSFKTSGIKLGGLGVETIHLVGNVYDLTNINFIRNYPKIYWSNLLEKSCKFFN